MARRKSRAKTASRPGSGRGGPRPTVYTGKSKRVIDFLKKHPYAPVSQARGHKPAEHATRKERARAAGKLDENQRAQVKRFAKGQASARRMNTDAGELYQQMLVKIEQPGGWAKFERGRDQVLRHAKMKRRRDRVRRLDKAGNVVTIEHAPERVWDDWEDFAADLDWPEEWLYYH